VLNRWSERKSTVRIALVIWMEPNSFHETSDSPGEFAVSNLEWVWVQPQSRYPFGISGYSVLPIFYNVLGTGTMLCSWHCTMFSLIKILVFHSSIFLFLIKFLLFTFTTFLSCEILSLPFVPLSIHCHFCISYFHTNRVFILLILLYHFVNYRFLNRFSKLTF